MQEKKKKEKVIKMSKKGAVSIYLAFIIVAIVITLIAAVFAPMGTLINTEFYAAGEDIMLRTNDSVTAIDDVNVRNSIVDMVGTSLDAQENNIEINSNIFKYSWIFIVGLSALVVYLYTRRLTEIQRGGLV
jgi:uncharacterized protein (UPF0333 family)